MLPKGYLKEHSSTISMLMRVLDCTMIVLSGILVFHLLMPAHYLTPPYRSAIGYAVVIALVVYPKCGIYQVWRGSSEREEIKAIFLSWSTLFICLIGLAFLLKESESFSRLWAGLWYLCGLLLWTFERMIVRFILRKIRKKGYNQRTVAIVGTGQSAYRTALTLSKARWTGLTVKGFYSAEENISDRDINILDTEILGNLQTLLSDIEHGGIDQIWIALPSDKTSMIQSIIRVLDTTTVDIRLVPDLYHLQLLNHSVSVINELPVIDLCMTPMQGGNKILKALEDKILASIILLLISPIMLILATIIKLTSPGPVFYKQERVGWNGKSFYMLKFRSMPNNNETGKVTWGNAKNKKTTPVGRFIRKTSLDELPQFINVLKGDMSIVGPRPERTIFVSQFKYNIPGYMKKHKVKAGITGWAQVHGWRGDTDLNKRIEFDLYYIENWSVFLDIKIIFLTIFKGLISKNAY